MPKLVKGNDQHTPANPFRDMNLQSNSQPVFSDFPNDLLLQIIAKFERNNGRKVELLPPDESYFSFDSQNIIFGLIGLFEKISANNSLARWLPIRNSEVLLNLDGMQIWSAEHLHHDSITDTLQGSISVVGPDRQLQNLLVKNDKVYSQIANRTIKKVVMLDQQSAGITGVFDFMGVNGIPVLDGMPVYESAGMPLENTASCQLIGGRAYIVGKHMVTPQETSHCNLNGVEFSHVSGRFDEHGNFNGYMVLKEKSHVWNAYPDSKDRCISSHMEDCWSVVHNGKPLLEVDGTPVCRPYGSIWHVNSGSLLTRYREPLQEGHLSAVVQKCMEYRGPEGNLNSYLNNNTTLLLRGRLVSTIGGKAPQRIIKSIIQGADHHTFFRTHKFDETTYGSSERTYYSHGDAVLLDSKDSSANVLLMGKNSRGMVYLMAKTYDSIPGRSEKECLFLNDIRMEVPTMGYEKMSFLGDRIYYWRGDRMLELKLR